MKSSTPLQPGDTTQFISVPSSQLSPHTRTDLPPQIRQTAPFLITSLPLLILFQAYDAKLGVVTFMIELFGKYLALETL